MPQPATQERARTYVYALLAVALIAAVYVWAVYRPETPRPTTGPCGARTVDCGPSAPILEEPP